VTTTQPNVTTTLQAPTDEPKPLTQTELLNTIKALSEASTEAIQGIVAQTLTKELDTSQATLLIASPAVLENITPTQAEQLFEQITPTELSLDEAEAVVAAVQEAPQEVREAFESTLNIFQGFADNYVPLNSTVPVSTRRALIAVGAVFLTLAPAPARRIR
jgi:glycyl-tRNA synthetase beta subunit